MADDDTCPDPRQWRLGAEHPETNAFIQWKNTSLCMDFYCECGEDGHFDGFFANAIKCSYCGSIWEMPVLVFPRKVAEAPIVQTLEYDED